MCDERTTSSMRLTVSSSPASTDDEAQRPTRMTQSQTWHRYTHPTQYTQKQIRMSVRKTTRTSTVQVSTQSIFAPDELEEMTQQALQMSKRAASEIEKRRRKMGWSEHDLGPEVRKLVEDYPVPTLEQSQFMKRVIFKARMRRRPPKVIHETIKGERREVVVIPDDDDPSTWYDIRFPLPEPEIMAINDHGGEDDEAEEQATPTKTKSTNRSARTRVELIYAKTSTKTTSFNSHTSDSSAILSSDPCSSETADLDSD